jgi:type 2A phosphatase activator TIP41
MPKTVPTKPYDWTYTTTYAGHPSSHSEDNSPLHFSRLSKSTIPWTPADPDNLSHSIPMAELTRPDPILFYAEIPLFEDELHDNGSSSLLVRIVRTSYRSHSFSLIAEWPLYFGWI